MASELTEDQFINLWMELRSAAKMAKALGMSVRAIQKRRAGIQERNGIILPGEHDRSPYKAFIPEDKMRILVEMSDGAFIAFSDAHFWPGIETTAFRALIHLIPEINPKMIIANGDILDGARISSHKRIGYEQRPTTRQELEAVQEALGKIEGACKGLGTQLFRTIGNHDIRFDSKLANEMSEYEGIHGMCLDDHLPFWTSSWSLMINEAVMIKHRWHNGIHATYNNALKGGVSIFTGHLHALGMTRFSDYNGTRFGVDTGTLADPYGPQFHYMEDNSRNWRSGFAVGTIVDGKLMPPEFCEVLEEGKVWWRGRQIDV